MNKFQEYYDYDLKIQPMNKMELEEHSDQYPSAGFCLLVFVILFFVVVRDWFKGKSL